MGEKNLKIRSFIYNYNLKDNFGRFLSLKAQTQVA
jgi:hypothetical protein